MAQTCSTVRAHVYHLPENYPARALISRCAFEHNLARAQELAGDAQIMAVIKADAYGHGAVQIAHWAQAAGVRWLCIAQLGEAMAVRREIGEQARILALLVDQDAPFFQALELGIDLTVGSRSVLDQIARAGGESGIPARVHVEVDTGMARGGVSLQDLPSFAAVLANYQKSGVIDVVGLWSHLACADDPNSPVTAQQIKLFDEARATLAAHGITPECVHLAASAGLLWHPNTRYSMVRPGIMLYGISPNPERATAQELGLQPVMQLEATVSSVRDVPAGTGVSYGHSVHTSGETRLATVPLGYGDGIPRVASECAQVWVCGARRSVCGRICMDQFVIDAPSCEAGDTATVFGGSQGAPCADEWAQWAGTISYEIVTRIGVRVPRVYVDDTDA